MESNQSRPILGGIIAAVVIMLLTAWVMLAVKPPPLGGLALLLVSAVSITLMLWDLWGTGTVADFLNSEAPETAQEFAGLDVWKMQATLMQISGQRMPQVPMLTKAGVLYGALILEEGGETMCALDALLLGYATRPGADLTENQLAAVDIIRTRFGHTGTTMQARARHIREFLETLPDDILDWKIPDSYAVELLDGTTDLAVVNAGFSLAFGLPGAPAYSEVGRSNLSKADHATGRIEVTADGKWIKGKGYFKPNLGHVLHMHRADAWVAEEQARVAAVMHHTV